MTEFFFARQPIFDNSKSVFGYELLFRNSSVNSYDGTDGVQATLGILSNALFHTTLEDMVIGKTALVNFPRELLTSDVVHLFSPQNVVIEVLEDVVPDEEIISACSKLKESGYRIAMDDFIAGDLDNPLLSIADIVKVDFIQAQGIDRKLIAEQLLPMNITLLAEKVETDKDYIEGLELGYKLFQGYFFSKPIIKVGRQITPNQITSVQMLDAVFKDPCEYNELNKIISSDISLSYRLLKLVNSPFFGCRVEITSIHHAISLMGGDGMKRFAALITVSSTAGNKSPELMLSCLARARIAEEIAPLIGYSNKSSALFLTGMFSLLDALLDCSMKDAMDQLPIALEIKSALLGEKNKLRTALDVIVAYEQGQWEKFSKAASIIELPEDRFPAIYKSAIGWANNILQLM